MPKEELRRIQPQGLRFTPTPVQHTHSGATRVLQQRRWECGCSLEGVPSNDLPGENKIKKITSKSQSSLTVPKACLVFFSEE